MFVDDDDIERDHVIEAGVSWSAFEDVFLNKEDFRLLTTYQKANLDKRRNMLIEFGKELARIFCVLLEKFSSQQDLKYILTLLNEIFRSEFANKMCSLFEELMEENPSIAGSSKLPFGPIFSVLSRETDPYIISSTSFFLSKLLCFFSNVDDEISQMTFTWFTNYLREGDRLEGREVRFRRQIKALENLTALLRLGKYRKLFSQDLALKIFFHLARYTAEIPTPSETQLVYQALYCIWLLSFSTSSAGKICLPIMIHNLCHIVKIAPKEKVIRLALAILKNVSKVDNNDHLMVSYGLMKSLGLIKSRPRLMADKDIKEDVEYLEKHLAALVDELNSFEVYKNEVLSKELEWSPAHRSPKFWQDNVVKFEADGLVILTTLAEILNDAGSTEEVLTIACWDLGEFARNNSKLSWRNIFSKLKIKEAIMRYLAHQNPDLAQAALVSIQKIMVTNWETLQMYGNGK